MNAITLKLDKHCKGAFVMEEHGERLAGMAVGISGKNLIVYHTEVSEKLKVRALEQS